MRRRGRHVGGGYGKLFAAMYTGSMFGAGLEVMALWPYVVCHARREDGRLELNPRLLAAIFGCEPSVMEKAIATLCAPDPESRNPVEEGRRLIHEGAFVYRVVNFKHYRKLLQTSEGGKALAERLTPEERSASARHAARIRWGRAHDPKPSHLVPSSLVVTHTQPQPQSTHKSAFPHKGEEGEVFEKKGPPRKPPTREEVQETADGLGRSDLAEQFFLFYELATPPWTDKNGRPIRNWEQTFLTWAENHPMKPEEVFYPKLEDDGPFKGSVGAAGFHWTLNLDLFRRGPLRKKRLAARRWRR